MTCTCMHKVVDEVFGAVQLAIKLCEDLSCVYAACLEGIKKARPPFVCMMAASVVMRGCQVQQYAALTIQGYVSTALERGSVYRTSR